jgi:hypothetical protein
VVPEADAIEWDEATFDAALKRAAEGVIEARRVRLSSDQLRQLLAAAPEDPQQPDRRLVREANFLDATFTSVADFGGATFTGDAHFYGASFSGHAHFYGARFSGDASFYGASFGDAADSRGASFSGHADFRGASFSGHARFGGASFSGRADFGGASFSGDASFYGASFGDVADFRGASFSGDADFRGASVSGYVHFDGASFSGDADLGEASFSGPADFSGASFSGDADFGEASFSGRANFGGASFSGRANFGGASFSGDAGFFYGATFGGDANFGGASFGGDAGFDEASFGGDAGFYGASFTRRADFGEASFGGDANFRGATISGDAHFNGATFSGDAQFNGATFSGYADFIGASFGANAGFGEARFEQTRDFGPVLVFGEIGLDRVVFARPVRIEVSAGRASLAGTVFRAGADVFVRWAEVSLEDADFAEPSLLAELPPTPDPGGGPSFLGWEERVADGGWVCRLGGTSSSRVCRLGTPPAGFSPRVVSARRAKLARLTLSGVDLRACRFAGAHGLDGLRLERARFAQPPSGRWRRLRWTRRQTIAEEHHWRAEHSHGRGWYEGEVRAPDWLEQPSEPPVPEQVVGIYRGLRKGREDSKDEPGAGDFYFGEMEMRRNSHSGRGHKEGASERSVSWAERWILRLYWLVAGYGLRASRALVALAITISLLGAVPLDLWGFRPERSYGRALLFSLESSISLLRAPEAKLTAGGEVIQIALRLAGPLFFGLALLSLRGRVKR